MAIVTAWLSDLKLGYCTQGWWLNRKFCCWEMVDEATGVGCEDWQEWTNWVGIQWMAYVFFSVRLTRFASYSETVGELMGGPLRPRSASSPSLAPSSSSRMLPTRQDQASRRSSVSWRVSSSRGSSVLLPWPSNRLLWCVRDSICLLFLMLTCVRLAANCYRIWIERRERRSVGACGFGNWARCRESVWAVQSKSRCVNGLFPLFLARILLTDAFSLQPRCARSSRLLRPLESPLRSEVRSEECCSRLRFVASNRHKPCILTIVHRK